MLGIDEIEERLRLHREFCDVREEQEKSDVLRKLKDKIMEETGLDLNYNDEDVHTVLVKMIKSGRIKAQIDMKKKIIVFAEEQVTIRELVQKLEEQSVKDIIEILKEVENCDKDLILQKKAGGAEMDEPLGDDRDAWMMEESMY